MATFKEDIVGTVQPDHVMYGSIKHKSHTELHEKYPNHYILSLTFLYNLAWNHVREVYGVKGFPPPLVVDHTKKFPYRKTDTGSVWTAAYFNRSWAYSIYTEYNGKSFPDDTVPDIYEIRLYSRAMRKDFNYFFDGCVTPWTLSILSMHTLFHELMHYLDACEMFEQYKEANTTEERFHVAQMMHMVYGEEDESPEEGFDIEQWTERRAIDLTRSFLRNELDDDLGIKLHGPMDNFMVRKYPKSLMHQSLLILEHLEYLFKEQYSSLEAYQTAHISDEHAKILVELAECADCKKSKYIIYE